MAGKTVPLFEIFEDGPRGYLEDVIFLLGGEIESIDGVSDGEESGEEGSIKEGTCKEKGSSEED